MITYPIDFECYSAAGYIYHSGKWCSLSKSPPHGLGAVGAAAYSEHPTTEVLSFAYDVGYPRLWTPGCPPPTDLFDVIARGGILSAWNSLFEFFIWLNVCHKRMGWPQLPYDQLSDTAAAAYAYSLPGKLETCAKALGADLKDPEGKRLITKFSKPKKPSKKNNSLRILPAHDPADTLKFWLYNLQDIKSEASIVQMIPPLSDFERQVWLADQAINIRGVKIDTVLLKKLIGFVDQIIEKYTAELRAITDGYVDSSGKVKKIKKWLSDNGTDMSTLAANAVSDALEYYDLPDNCRRVLELRQLLGLGSVQKLYAIERRLLNSPDGRLRGLFVYCGASRTGRWAGRGPQPQNLPKGKFADGIENVTTLAELEATYGPPLETISRCLRGLFCASPGHRFICSDYSAIEAVVLAELAGESWRQEVFRTHGKIYEMSASKITGVPFEEFMRHKAETGEHHPLRGAIGKVAELASQYKGWINAWMRFGAGEYFTSDVDLKTAILKWRDESPAIVEFWGGQLRKHPYRWSFTYEFFGIEGAAVQAVLHPGQVFSYRRIPFYVANDILFCVLPSGRRLTYHQPRLAVVSDPYSRKDIYQISYMGMNNDQKQGPIGWIRLTTHGGKLTENIDQAVARDIMAHALVNLEARGFPVVLDVHDEVIADVLIGWGSIAELESIMSTMPPWAKGWPIFAKGGWEGPRFKKA